MRSDFFFSKSVGIYVSRKPLKIDSRVKKAVEKSNLRIQWDDEGRINFVDFDLSKKLLVVLGSFMLSPVEYWKVLEDAKKEGDEEMVSELTSDKYGEWLDRVYLRDNHWIDHPDIIKAYKYSGEKKPSIEPLGKPGWFNPEGNINFELGIPKKIKLFREKFSASWKYWSPDFSVSEEIPRAPIRGYVTSVGKPSFDQGMPVDSKQPMQMIRECRKKPLEPPIKLDIIHEAIEVLEEYTKENPNTKKIIVFLDKYGALLKTSKELAIYKIRERFFDLLGKIKVQALSEKDKKILTEIASSSKSLSDLKLNEISYKKFKEFIINSDKRLENALKNKKDIVFVMGHKNPDTDTVISSLFEAWRNHLLDGKKATYISIVQDNKIPEEVRALIGDEISNSILLSGGEAYKKTRKSGLARWISVDQNREPEVQKYFISIIDHHIASEIAKAQDLPKTLEIIGSCTSLVVQKILGMGIYPDKETAKILYGSTLMDTENRALHKMTEKDKRIMDYLKKVSCIEDEDRFYSHLMSFLLNTNDPNILFSRDYKEDWGFGFAVAKIKKGFDKKGNTLKPKLIAKTVRLAKQNNQNKNLPLTILRITDYEEDNKTVNRERVYLIFNKQSPKEFKRSVFELLEKIVKFEFKDVEIRTTEKYVEFYGTGMQLSRKKTAPILEPVVKSFNEYFYSPSNNLWVKRNFLKQSSEVIKAENEVGIKASTDEEKRVNYLIYPEARELTKKLGFSMLSLGEYWKCLKDAKKIKDIQMIESLQGSNFVEFLDTIIKDYSRMVNHPKITKEEGRYLFEGKEIPVKIPQGKPGLIHPESIDPETGIPKEVRLPNEYGNPELWRYWGPDKDLIIPVRSYIFLLKQPCWDGKFHVKDSFPNLGIRPCCKISPIPKVKVSIKDKSLKVEIKKEGDIITFSWDK